MWLKNSQMAVYNTQSSKYAYNAKKDDTCPTVNAKKSMTYVTISTTEQNNVHDATADIL